MMAHTPHATPLRDTYAANSKLPLIVDIAIDPSGKQMYQVHELLKLVRKEMPRLTHFLMGPHPDLGAEAFVAEAEKTPIRNVLGTLLPLTLSQKKYDDEDDRKFVPPLMPVFNYNFDAAYPESEAPVPRSQDNDIWLDDVEAAFEEGLRLIPKNGLTKIKILGRLCGRNELILDYIFSKTGKFRTRKQVSLHIQVIKNLGQKLDVIRLINEGPVFSSEQEQQENMKRFEEVFSNINMVKLLGFTEERRALMAASGQPPAKRRKMGAPRFQKIGVHGFSMAITDSYGLNPMYLSMLEPGPARESPSLKLNDNVNVQARFPGLGDFQGLRIPVVHNMVKVAFPPALGYNYLVEQGFKAQFTLGDASLPVTPVPLPTGLPAADGYSLFTAVYLYGNEVIKFNEEGIHVDQETPFLTKFWKFFISKFMGKDSAKVNLAFKGMTIKQIVYERDPGATEVHTVPKNRIKLVLLWEFATVADIKDAITTTTKLILPTKEQQPAPTQLPQVNIQRKFQLLQQYLPQPPQYDAYATQLPPPPPFAVHHLANVDLMMMPNQENHEFGGLLYPEGYQEF